MRRGMIHRIFPKWKLRRDLQERYRRSRAGLYAGVSFETYLDDPDYYDEITAALKSGRALQRIEGSGNWAIVG